MLLVVQPRLVGCEFLREGVLHEAEIQLVGLGTLLQSFLSLRLELERLHDVFDVFFTKFDLVHGLEVLHLGQIGDVLRLGLGQRRERRESHG